MYRTGMGVATWIYRRRADPLKSCFCLFFPQTGLPVGFYLRKKVTGHAGPGWARIWPCWARWAVLGRGIWPCWACWAGLGVGFGSGGRAGLGWARLLWVYVDLIDLLALFGVYAGIILLKGTAILSGLKESVLEGFGAKHRVKLHPSKWTNIEPKSHPIEEENHLNQTFMTFCSSPVSLAGLFRGGCAASRVSPEWGRRHLGA